LQKTAEDMVFLSGLDRLAEHVKVSGKKLEDIKALIFTLMGKLTSTSAS